IHEDDAARELLLREALGGGGADVAGADDGDLVHHEGKGVRSPAPGVHLSVRIGAERIDSIQRAPVRHPESLLRAAIGAALPRLPDERRELVIGGTAAQRLAQIEDRKSTRLNSSHGSISYAV